MAGWDLLDLQGLWDDMDVQEQTTSASAGGFAVPFPGPLRRPDLVGEPVGEPVGAGPQLDGFEDAFEYLKRNRQ